tara:strand:+ start:273 stop:494 length:222 start_codon:yes stop_codon:yes gene_type:complete
MAFKGTAGKSASGASMSKYDVEVEARLQALEKAVAECKAACAATAHTHTSDGGDVSAVVAALKAQWPNKFTDL